MKTNKRVGVYEDEKSIGLEMIYTDGQRDRFGVKKGEKDAEEIEECKNYYDEFSESVARYGDDMKNAGYQDGRAEGRNEGFNGGILCSGVALIFGWLVCKYYDWKKKNEK